ncbi:MAG: peptidylprolyl isomerase [Chitinispirillaceae bacterium]
MGNQVLIKVNDKEISENDVIIRLKNKGEYKKALVEVIELAALKQAAAEQGVVISEDELQSYSDKKRQELGLFSVADTEKHFGNLGISLDQWADHLENELLEIKAKEKLFTDEDVKQYYEQNKILYTTANVSRIMVEDQDTAEEIITQLEEGEDFAELAEDNSTDSATAEKGGYLGMIKRGILSPDIENRLFAAQKGAVEGPFKENNGYSVYKVNEHSVDALDDRLEKEILESLYKYWKQNFMASVKLEQV